MKTVIDFLKDLEDVQDVICDERRRFESYYAVAENASEADQKKREELVEILNSLEIEVCPESLLALVTRLVSLREEPMVQVLKKAGRTEVGIDAAKALAYNWVSSVYTSSQERILDVIQARELLTPFYREVLKGVHMIGQAFNQWQPRWTQVILEGVNRRLLNQFQGDRKAVHEYLARESLLDKGHKGEIGDRSYSALVDEGGRWVSKAYSEVFPDDVQALVFELKEWSEALKNHSDNTFHEGEEWLKYIETLRLALIEKDVNRLIPLWSDVDRAWMKITGPIQPAHPLEYYEDHFRSAVALEWDLRISNPEHATRGARKDKVKAMSWSLFESLNLSDSAYVQIARSAMDKLDAVQLHIGRVGFCYGADFCGIPSAQVVPNDEEVSSQVGKKIFAFPDRVLDDLRARPFMRLTREVYDSEFIAEQRRVLFQDRILWFHLYDISTLGHEYGHILWVGEETEARMNVSGNYKNVEEWKATMGGLITFFQDSQGEASSWDLKKRVIDDLVKRSVGMISAKEISEAEPYYAESMIHLAGLFESKTLDFSPTTGLKLKIDEATYSKLTDWYLETYRELVSDYYLPRKDPSEFLYRFVRMRGDRFIPRDSKITQMADWFWDLYQKFGREIDTTDHKDNYLPFDC